MPINIGDVRQIKVGSTYAIIYMSMSTDIPGDIVYGAQHGTACTYNDVEDIGLGIGHALLFYKTTTQLNY